jgi:hypothetical protein
MRVKVYHIYSGDTDTYSGSTEQIRNQLNAAFPFLKKYNGASLQDDLSKLSQQQALMLSVEE